MANITFTVDPIKSGPIRRRFRAKLYTTDGGLRTSLNHHSDEWCDDYLDRFVGRTLSDGVTVTGGTVEEYVIGIGWTVHEQADRS